MAERLTVAQIHDILNGTQGDPAGITAAIERLEAAEQTPAVGQALEALAMAQANIDAFLKRRKVQRGLPEVPKGYKRLYADIVRREHRRTALGRTQQVHEAMFIRALKRGFQAMQNRILRRLRGQS